MRKLITMPDKASQRQIVSCIRSAQKKIDKEISLYAKRSRYAAGMSTEGYLGGYRDALSDVLLVLSGCVPCVRPEYWIVPTKPDTA
jgi:hypothetical protein